MAEDKRFAVLIDIENISQKYVGLIMDEASNYGDITIKRAYGDWTQPASASWRKVLLENSIIPMQQFNNTFGKNSSDSALIIDAMKILYNNNVDGFCLVSSDSDFTRLAATIKEEGKVVVGMGESKTPNALIKACDSFKMLDVLYKEQNEEKAEKAKKTTRTRTTTRKTTRSTKKTAAQVEEVSTEVSAENGVAEATEKAADNNVTKISTIEKAIKQIITAHDDENGMNISTLGNSLQRRYPDFDTRNYGSSKLSKFLAEFDSLTLTRIGNSTYVNVK
ncbi:MAG: NYN domain-containing protein [Lachnospiraceae bacterium]|nr:NYN domain-containing protein [Lachnospiraceae bacterium]